VETDAPFVLPYCKDQIPSKALRKTRNSSLILPAIIEKIAQLKGISPTEVERATTEIVIRLFHLPLCQHDATK
jgi:Tat protein secretion system quality control protein TatD with DNase activity